MAGAGRAGQPWRMDHDDRAQPGDRPSSSAQAAHREDGGASSRDGPRIAARSDRSRLIGERHGHRGRPTTAHLHLLSPGPGHGCSGRPDPAHARWPDDAGDRSRLPDPGADPRSAPRPGQAQDPRRRHPVPRAAAGTAAGAAGRRPAGPLPRIQRGLRRDIRGKSHPTRIMRRGDPPDTDRRVVVAR